MLGTEAWRPEACKEVIAQFSVEGIETCTKEVAEETERTCWILDTEERQTVGTANILLTVGKKKQGGQGGLQDLGLPQLDGGGAIFQKEEGYIGNLQIDIS